MLSNWYVIIVTVIIAIVLIAILILAIGRGFKNGLNSQKASTTGTDPQQKHSTTS